MLGKIQDMLKIADKPKKIKPDNYYVIYGNNIYYSMWGDPKTGSLIPDADPKTFRLISKDKTEPACGYDCRNFYFNNLSLKSPDVKKLNLLGDGYMKDDHTVYYYGYPVKDADASTFAVIGNGYAKDKQRFFYRMKELK
ncbi:MAG: DKNYY domain-containing protein [Candidatus Micrarchaeota archaeon]